MAVITLFYGDAHLHSPAFTAGKKIPATVAVAGCLGC